MTVRKAPKKTIPANKAKQKETRKKSVKGRAPTQPTAKQTSKQAQLIVLLQQTQGTSIAEAASALGWLPHSIRGVLSGVIKKKLKLPVEKFDADGVTRYRVAG